MAGGAAATELAEKHEAAVKRMEAMEKKLAAMQVEQVESARVLVITVASLVETGVAESRGAAGAAV